VVDSIGVGDDVGIGDGVRDVESGLMIFDGDGEVGVEGSIKIAYKQVVEDLIVLYEWKTHLDLNDSCCAECSNRISLRSSHVELFIAGPVRSSRPVRPWSQKSPDQTKSWRSRPDQDQVRPDHSDHWFQ
jgi:hypothetical protein